MALKFRRGTTAQKSGSLTFGEPYVNTTLGTLQIGGNSGDITLLINSSSQGISGSSLDITGNAKIDGNLTLGGAITIGDASADTVNVVASLSSSLIPSITNAFDLGSETHFWRDVYVSTGSIKFVGAAGSVVGTLTNQGNGLNLDGGIVTNGNSTFGTSSLSTTIVTGSLLVNGNIRVTNGGITGSIAATNGVVSGSSQIISILDSLNTFSGSQLTQNSTLATTTGSINTSVSNLNTTTASLNTSVTNINLTTASLNTSVSDINSYTSSLKTALSLSGADLIVLGNLTVQGDTTTLNTANLLVEDKLIEIASGSTTSAAADGAGIFISGANASILWDHTNSTLDINKSVDITGNITLTGNVDGVDVSVLNTNINSFSSSQLTQNSTLATYTGSVNTRLTEIGVVSGSLISSASADRVSITNLNTTSASLNTSVSNLNTTTASLNTSVTNLNTTTASLNTSVSNLNLTTASLLIETANLESFTSSINTTIKSKLDADGVISGSAQINVASTTGDIALGTRTSGNYVATITAGTGVSSTGATTGEGVAHTISIGQAVATSDNVRFNSLGVGMAASATAGRIDATNDVVAFSSSDIRFKENIKPIENAIDKIRKISGNTYNWKEENKIEHGYEGNDVGVIAQEIEAVLPQLVQTRESGYKAVKYDKLVALLIEGIKEQQLQIEQLRIDLNNCRNNKGL